MSTMNKHKRDEVLGEFKTKSAFYNKQKELFFCQGDNCGRELNANQVRVDHIDNDNSNNDQSNLQPLCASCNTKNSGKSIIQLKRINKKKRKAFESGLSKATGITAMIEINRAAEPLFREWVIKQIETYGFISWVDLIDGGCEYVSQTAVQLSQATAERYLRKLTSIAGPLIATGIGDSRIVELRNKKEIFVGSF